MPDVHLYPNGYPLCLWISRFDSLTWRKMRYTCICTPQRLAYHYEHMLVTKEENRNKEYLKVHVEFCGRFSELHVIATATDSFSTNLVWIYEILHRLLVLPFEEQVAFYRVCQNYKILAVPYEMRKWGSVSAHTNVYSIWKCFAVVFNTSIHFCQRS